MPLSSSHASCLFPQPSHRQGTESGILLPLRCSCKYKAEKSPFKFSQGKKKRSVFSSKVSIWGNMHFCISFQQKTLNQFHFSALTSGEKCPPLAGRETHSVPSTCCHLSTQQRDRQMDCTPHLCKTFLGSQEFLDSETAPLTFYPQTHDLQQWEYTRSLFTISHVFHSTASACRSPIAFSPLSDCSMPTFLFFFNHRSSHK